MIPGSGACSGTAAPGSAAPGVSSEDARPPTSLEGVLTAASGVSGERDSSDPASGVPPDGTVPCVSSEGLGKDVPSGVPRERSRNGMTSGAP
ncbi:hypothetical protein [Streptomyces althioticus]|uniref:hypothetical protein n=1 Tax=Streptomyces althioticus TaxID=83380 RepID=UPI003EB77498